MKQVVVLIPTLGRPHHIEPLLNSLYSTTDDARPLFLVTPEDAPVIDAIRATSEEFMLVNQKHRGDYARKINHGYRNSKEPFLFLGATDLKFHDDWLENAMKRVTKKKLVIGTNDLGNPRVIRGEHSTHSLVYRKYCDKFGTIDKKKEVLHEGYAHEYVDDEFIETAKCRDQFEMALDSVVEHLHPTWGKGRWDRSYKSVDKRLQLGYRHYHRRRTLWTQL